MNLELDGKMVRVEGRGDACECMSMWWGFGSKIWLLRVFRHSCVVVARYRSSGK
jgi:hypothetical protein